MKEMRKMKDSGVEWIGEIPTDWTVLKNKFLFSIQSGEAITREDLIENGTYPVYGGGEKIGYYDKYNVSENSILIGRVGARCGCITLVNTKCWATDNALIITNVDNYQYVSYVLDSANLNRLNDSNAQPLITATKILNVSVPFPPFPEQQTIAAYLNRKCSEIDALMTDIQNEIETLGEYKRSVITEAVTKGLNPDVEMRDSSVQWIEKMPKHWGETRIGYVAWLRARLGWKGLKADEYVDEGYPLLSAFNIIDSLLSWNSLNLISQERYDESPEIMLHIGDILLVKDGAGIGKCARVDELPMGEATTNGSLAVITTDSKLYYKYLYYYFLSGVFQNYIQRIMNGMGVPHLSQEEMRKIKIPLPPISDQKAVSEYLDNKCGEIHFVIQAKRQQLETLAEYKKSLIYEYVTGKKEVI